MKIKALLLSLFTAIAPLSVSASLVTQTFDNGTDLSAWNNDRCAPDSVGVNSNELVMSVSSDSDCLDQDPFRHTQGIKLDIGQSNFLSIDMFIDSSWGNANRFAGLWGTGFNSLDEIVDYPIMEFQIPGSTTAADGTVDVWASNAGFVGMDNAFNLDGWNTFAFSLNNGVMNYYLNDSLVYTNNASGAAYIGEVILNAKNEGNSYDVRYDNLQYGTQDVNVPAPGAGALMAMGLVLLFIRRVRQ